MIMSGKKSAYANTGLHKLIFLNKIKKYSNIVLKMFSR